MARPRDKEKMSQATLTEYFCVRKTHKRSADNFKGEEKLSKSPIPNKILVLDSDLISRKKKKISQSSGSSKLLISVLNKNAKLTTRNKKVSRNENNNPNVKNVSKNENSALDSTKVEAMKISSASSNEVVLSKQVTLEENTESSSGKISISTLSAKKKVNADEPLRKDKKIQSTISKNLQNDVVPLKKLPKTAKPEINETKTFKEAPLPEPKKFQTKTEGPRKPAAINRSPKTRLPLPNDYKFLGQVFTCIDRVALMLYNRGEIITFRKLLPALQNMSKKDITLDHLAQIKTIYPEAYFYENKKLRTFASWSRTPQNEMVLIPNFESPKTAQESNVSEKTTLLKRRQKFYNTLLERVKEEHEKFLLRCTKLRPVVPVKQWHPRFQIEKCKPIELSELPIIHNIKLTSKEVLEVKECYKIDTNSTRSPEIVSKPIEMKLEDKREEYYRRLPSIAKVLRSIFLYEKKNVLTFNFVVQKVQYSYNENLSLYEMEKHLRLLCELVPQWIDLFNLGKTDRLKFDKNISFEKVSKILEALAKKK